MRALLLNSQRRINLQSIEFPKLINKKDVLIKVHYSPVNPSDLGFSQNVYGRFGHPHYPIGLGFEGSGVIHQSEDKSLIGKRVCFVVNYEKENFVGAWSDYTIASQSEYTILPDSFTDMQKAAYLLINPLTALCFIDIMKRSNSSSVLHTAGASALGRMFTRLCAKNNFSIINTVRKEKHVKELTDIGSSLTLLTSKENFRENLLQAKSQFRPKVAFESIGGEMTGNIFNALEEEGTLYHYGNLSLRNCSNISTGDLIFLDKKIRGFWLFKYLNDTKDNDVMSNFFLYLESEPQLFDTSIQGVFKPHQFEDAFQLYRKEMSRGKVLFDFNFIN